MKKSIGSNVSKLYTFLIYLFLYLPIIVLVIFSFNNSKFNAVWTGFTLKWYKSLLTDYSILAALKNSLIVAVVSSLVSVIIGTITAVGMYKYKFKGKGVLDGLLYVPVVIPEIVMGIALLAFFSQAKINLGLGTLIIAHITFSISYVVIVVRARLDGFDRAVEEAAMDLGADSLTTFFKITLPMIMPGVVAGGMMAFTLSLDDVIISFFVAGSRITTLPLQVYSMVKFGVTPEINALSTILMIFTLAIVIFSDKLKSKNIKGKKMTKIMISLLLCTIIIGGGIFNAVKSADNKQQVLNVFNWSEYLPQSVIDKFEQTYNIKVNYCTFSSNEEMLAKLMAGGSNYDLVVSSDYMVDILKKQNLIQPIDKSQLTNFKNIGDNYKNLEFDKGNLYSVPYMSGDAAIVYDATKVKENITSCADLWNSKYKNSIVVLDDERAIVGMALKKLGYSINDTDPSHLAKAEQELIKLQPNIKAYDSDSPKTMLINGEASIGYVWGAEAALAKRENRNLKVVIPKEGLFLQQDNFVLPKNSKNVKSAELFMNFIMEPEISSEISKVFPYANPNTAAYPFIDKSILDDIGIYPPEEDLKKGEYLKDIGDKSQLIDKIWSKVKQ
ncbi:extracellular solute-binding protein [Candidatus Clostridium stratigraminis]|uniref:Extracellular solute-binding protein n=1 Tax=Candidatus Clostridium stratigraminis TaxID=3381661 RepID=A0ABW8T424_9CLOT